MFKIALCDDDVILLDCLEDQIRNVLETKNFPCQIDKFTTGEDLLDVTNLGGYSTVFLDIQMPGMNGFDTARLIRSKCPDIFIVFITSYPMLVFQSFEFSPLWFIRKNELLDNCSKTLPLALDKIMEKYQFDKQKYLVKGRTGSSAVKLTDIHYFESRGHTITVHCRQKSYTSRGTLKEIESQLGGLNFVRIHSGYLVNLANVRDFYGCQMVMEDDTPLPVSRHRYGQVKQRYLEYLRTLR